MLAIKLLLLVIKPVCNFICLGWKKVSFFMSPSQFGIKYTHYGLWWTRSYQWHIHILHYCHFLPYFQVAWKGQGSSCQSKRVCRRTQLPPREWARVGAKEKVLQHPLGTMGLEASAWPHSSSCYHHEVQEKGWILTRHYLEFPFPMVASGCVCLSQNYEVYHHEGSLLTTTASTKRGRNVVVGARKAIFLPSSVQRALSGLHLDLLWLIHLMGNL